MKTYPTAFIFNSFSENAPGNYGDICDQAFVDAAGLYDQQGQTSSLILRGDLILYNLAKKIISVQKGEKGVSHTQGYDYELINTVLHDLVVEIESGWNTIERGSLLGSMLRHSIYCLVFPALPSHLRESYDGAFRKINFYIGALEVDLGNPVQVTGFINMLIKSAAVHQGAIYLEKDCFGDVHTIFEGSSQFKPNGLKIIDQGRFFDLVGPIPNAELSKGGARAVERYFGKQKLTLQERVIDELSKKWNWPVKKGFSVTTTSEPDALFDAVLPPPKFVAFLLNPDHKDNKGRAAFFKDLMNIEAKDWRYLMAQIQEGISNCDIEELSTKEWEDGSGISFNVPITMVGINGRSVKVVTNWIMRKGEKPSLSTIIPRSERATSEVVPPAILESAISAPEKWKKIHEMAACSAEAAARSIVPTPMFIGNSALVAEGECGSATIIVADARRGFAKWLIKNNIAFKGYRPGATINAKAGTQSVDRAFAYAKAYARVLQYNGIECFIERHVD